MRNKLFIERDNNKYFVKKDNQHILASANTQANAIKKAENIDPNAFILAERVRMTSVGKRDKWRKIN